MIRHPSSMFSAVLALSALVIGPGAAVGQAPPAAPPTPGGAQLKAPPADPATKFNPDEYSARQPANPAAAKAEEQSEAIEAGARVGLLVGGPLVWIGLAAVLMSVGAWVYVKVSATTNPRKIALSDPWIRARLADNRPLDPPAEHEQEQPAR